MDPREFSKWKLWQQMTTGVTGALILGVIGSGIWDKVGDPAYSMVRDKLLDFATLGVSAWKDNTYQRIALGLHEHASVMVFGLVLIALSMVCVIISLGFILTWFHHKSDKGVPDVALNLAITLRGSWSVWLSSVMGLFAAVSLILHLIQATYVHDAIAHFNLLAAVVRPVVDEHQMDIFNSRYAQIQNAGDFRLLVDELTAIAKKNDFKVPPFYPW